MLIKTLKNAQKMDLGATKTFIMFGALYLWWDAYLVHIWSIVILVRCIYGAYLVGCMSDAMHLWCGDDLVAHCIFGMVILWCIFSALYLWWDTSMVWWVFGMVNPRYAASLVSCTFGVMHLCCDASLAGCIFGELHIWFDASLVYYRVSQKKRSLRISISLGPTDASGDNSVGKGCWGDVGWW